MTATGPSPSEKSRSFGGERAGSRHSAKIVNADELAFAPITAAILGASEIGTQRGITEPGPTIAAGLTNAKKSRFSNTRTAGG